MLTRATWAALSAARLRFRAAELVARRVTPTEARDVRLRSPAGHDLPARLHHPVRGAGRRPGVLVCPGGLDGLGGGEGLSVVLGCQRLARAGFAALCWSPSGREGASGVEDRNGAQHQAEAVEALQVLATDPAVDAERLVVLTISFGVVLGLAAAIARPQGVRGLVDWEGPPSRRWFVASRLELRSRPEEEAFWTEREAARRIGALRVPYWRAQGSWDHVHGPETGLALEMVDAAVAGGVPDVRLNRGRTWAPPKLLSSAIEEQSAAMLGWITELTA